MLGVLGGMGPMATVDFMRKVIENTPAGCDQDHLATIVCSASDIPDRTTAIFGDGPDPLPAMTASLRRLEGAGATCIAIPCNTAHHWHAALQALTAIPILHIVDAVADALDLEGLGRRTVGLLATSGTVRAGLYQDRLARHGLVCRTPDGQDDVMRAIGLIKAGEIDRASVFLRAQAEGLIAAGCGRVVLACTEIPIALDPTDDLLQPWLLDATDALARACVATCLPNVGEGGKPAPQDHRASSIRQANSGHRRTAR